MRVYTDPKLLDVAGAVAALPSMNSRPIRQVMAATGTESKKFVALTVAPAGVLYGQKQSIPDIFSGKPHGLSRHEKSLVSQGKTRLLSSRGERIRTFDPLVPNQMR